MASWITLADAKPFLRFDPADTSDDATLQGVIDGACSLIEDVKGVVGEETVTAEDYDVEQGGRVFLKSTPVASVQSVDVLNGDGTTISVPPDDPLNGVAGWVIVTKGGVLGVPYVAGTKVRVSYTAGRNPVPSNYVEGALEMTAHLWRSSQMNATAGRSGYGMDDTEAIRGSTYAFPFKVRELLGIWGKVVKSKVYVR